jgi:hypothetical protein
MRYICDNPLPSTSDIVAQGLVQLITYCHVLVVLAWEWIHTPILRNLQEWFFRNHFTIVSKILF